MGIFSKIGAKIGSAKDKVKDISGYNKAKAGVSAVADKAKQGVSNAADRIGWDADDSGKVAGAARATWGGVKTVGRGGAAAVGAVGAGAAAVGIGAAVGLKKVSRGLLSLSGRGTWIFFILCALAHASLFIDMKYFVLNGFLGTIQSIFATFIDIRFSIYILLALLAAFFFYRDSTDPFPMRSLVKFLLLTIFAYLLPITIHSVIVATGGSWVSMLKVVAMLSFPWLYFIMADPADQLTKMFSYLVFLIITFLIVVNLISTLRALGEGGEASTNFDTSDGTFWTSSWWIQYNKGKEVVQQDARSAYDRFKQGWSGQLNRTTQDYYGGQVDQSQGAPLGVFIEQPRADYQRYYVGDGDVITASAVIKARSLVEDEIRVLNKCYIEVLDERDLKKIKKVNISGKVSPPTSIFSYTADFQDVQDIQCVIETNPKEVTGKDADGNDEPKLKDLMNKDRTYSGTVYFEGTFDFTTLAYLQYAFMDAELHHSMRRDNLDPAKEMGVKQNPVAMYTPGPLMIGMARDTQPFPYDVPDKTTQNFDWRLNEQLPSLGVTFGSSTLGKGKLVKFHELHFYIPQQFELKIKDDEKPTELPGCSPLKAREKITGGADPNGEVVWSEEGRSNYWDYKIVDVAPQEGDNFLTFRCHLLRNQGGTGSNLPLLTPAGASLYTFYAKARYSYMTSGRVDVTIRGKSTTVPSTGADPAVCIGSLPSNAPAAGTSSIFDNSCSVTSCLQCPSGTACTCAVKNSDGVVTSNCGWYVGNEAGKTCDNVASTSTTTTTTWPQGAPAKGSPSPIRPACTITRCDTVGDKIRCYCEVKVFDKTTSVCYWNLGDMSSERCNPV